MTPWPALLAQACRLGLKPHEFWSLSLMEWRALTAGLQAAPLDKTGLAALLRQYPDNSDDT